MGTSGKQGPSRRSGARVEAAPKVGVDAEEQHGGVLGEGGLGAVAVVDVPGRQRWRRPRTQIRAVGDTQAQGWG